MRPLLAIENLNVVAASTGGSRPILSNISLSVAPAEVVGLIGESGAGKSTLARMAMGFLKSGAEKTSGTVVFDGVDLSTLDTGALSSLRGRHVAYVAQSPAAAFNPARTLGWQIAESLATHAVITSQGDRTAQVRKQLRELGLPEGIDRRFPHEVSGGQQQRAMLAMAMTCMPKLLILDEPTTALDVTTQIDVLKAIKSVIRTHGVSALYVSHDLAVVAQVADRIAVMKDGCIIEIGKTDQIINAPREPYTRSLLKAADRAAKTAAEGDAAPLSLRAEPLVKIEAVTTGHVAKGFFRKTIRPVVKSVSLELMHGEALGIVGESGSGKTTLARSIAGLHAIQDGAMMFEGRRLERIASRRSPEDLRRIQIVFQSSEQSLNPRRTVGATLGQVVRFFFGTRKDVKTEVARLLEEVDLPASFAGRFPSELSGGQRQRVSIARALAAEPEVLICDEVLSALDTVVAERIIGLLARLKQSRNLSMLFISHDLGVVRALTDRVAVMKHGELVEVGSTENLFVNPKSDYARRLISSVPQLRKGWLEEAVPSDG